MITTSWLAASGADYGRAWEVKREGRFDWQVWRFHAAGVAEAVGKPHWFFWFASRHMMREAEAASRALLPPEETAE